jgi:HEAT repeat protein
MLATALREGAEPERQIAARALGGTGDRSFLPQLRAVAASDQSEKVRGRAFEGLTHLLGGASVSDLLNGAKDPSASVRRSVAIHAYNMARKGGDPEARSGTRRVLLLLSEDAAPDVRESARSWLKQLDSPH